jgi:hypothetical protein
MIRSSFGMAGGSYHAMVNMSSDISESPPIADCGNAEPVRSQWSQCN